MILANAIAATAALPTLRMHAEIAATAPAMLGAGANGGAVKVTIDADIDLATRQVVARTTASGGGNGGVAQDQVSEMVVTRAASFTRNGQTGRWSKFPSNLAAGPTNVQIATMVSNLLSNPAMSAELAEAGSCTLGTCDHVIVHIDGATLGSAIATLNGVPVDAANQAMFPSFDVDVLVDQATSVISELRTSINAAGMTEQVLVQVSNPGQPVQIAAPPAALTDDFGVDLGADFDGSGIATPMPIAPAESAILEEVGNELESDLPGEPLPSTP